MFYDENDIAPMKMEGNTRHWQIFVFFLNSLIVVLCVGKLCLLWCTTH